MRGNSYPQFQSNHHHFAAKICGVSLKLHLMCTRCLSVASKGPTPWKKCTANACYLTVIRKHVTVNKIFSNKAFVMLERYKNQNSFLVAKINCTFTKQKILYYLMAWQYMSALQKWPGDVFQRIRSSRSG